MQRHEARIILPLRNNDGIMLNDLHMKVQEMLSKAFGGWTSTVGKGGWIDPVTKESQREDVVVYDVAVDQSFTTHVLLDTIAGIILTEGEQKTVYVRYPNGIVRLIARDTFTIQEEAA